MPLISPGHWEIGVGDSWGSIAKTCKVDRARLAVANSARVDSDGVVRPALNTTPNGTDVGRVIHVPFPDR